jgi:signal transduction histidine kinase/ligand-binding sensor domain-containing protein
MLLSLSPLGATTNSAWSARAWQTEDGLPEHTIVGLEQTADGYLWVATHEGLFRFDGVRFQEFTPAMRPGRPAAQIRVMLLDRQGRLWLAKDGGTVICVSNGAVAQVLDLSGFPFGGQPQSMAEADPGAIWVSDNAGSIFRIQQGQVQVFGTAQGLGQGSCRLTTDVQGQLWFSQAGRIGLFRNGRFVTLITMGRQSAPLARARQGGVWLCSGSNLYRYQEGGELQPVAGLKLEPGRSEVEAIVLYEDKSRGLWIGAGSAGLLRYDSRGIQTVDLSLPAITTITEDSEGDLWVGARGGGLNRFRPRAAEVFGLASGLPFVAVRSACEDGVGTLWAAGENGALACRTNDLWKLVSSDDGWHGGWVTCLAAEAGGGVLLGTRYQGVFRYHNRSFVALALNRELTNLFIRSLCACANGDLWVGPDSGGTLHRYRDGRLKTFVLPAGAGNVRTLAWGPQGNLWAATANGRLLQVAGEVLTDQTTDFLPPSHKGSRCLLLTRDGSLWIGSAGQGLGRLKNGRYFEFRSHHGLWDEYISQILPDDQGRLWIAGNRGIFQVARSELEAVAEGRAFRVRSVVLGRGEGLPNLRATFGVWPLGARCRDGRLLMPMLTGLAVIQPNLLRKNTLPPPVVIEQLRVNGQIAAALDITGEADHAPGPVPVNLHTAPAALRLGPGVKQLELEFTALSLASPENVTFRYKLEGLDQDWVEAGATRFARYPRVPPGDYCFHVSACGHDGIWNEIGASLAFSVRPYLWEAAWFRIAAPVSAAGVLGGGLLLAVRRRYRRKIERLEQRQALERERTRIAQDLHDDLGSGLVEINLGSELAQDTTLSVGEVREHTREIGARAREMVTALDEIVWAVNPKHDTLASLATYFCQYAQHFFAATSVRCHLAVARNLPAAPLDAEQRHSLFLAFKEALCNAVQHSGATDLRLSITAPEGILIVTMSDNGSGWDPGVPDERVGADGLGNMRRRLQQLGGRCELTTSPGGGTTVTFRVPLAGSAARSRHNSIEVL